MPLMLMGMPSQRRVVGVWLDCIWKGNNNSLNRLDNMSMASSIILSRHCGAHIGLIGERAYSFFTVDQFVVKPAI